MRLFVGDDWAEDHHDVELMDAAGRVLARKRLPEGVAGMARLHELTGLQLGEDAEDPEVVVDLAGDVTLQAADDLRLGFPFGGAAPGVGAGARVRAQAGEHDPP